MTNGQRVLLSAVEEARSFAGPGGDDGPTYYTYTSVAQGSPNNVSATNESYRRAVATTVLRGGYLLTVSLSAPDALWGAVGPAFTYAAESFRLEPEGDRFVAPPGNVFDIF